MTTTARCLEIRVIRLPLVDAFRTSRSSESARELLVLRWIGTESEGWAECAAGPRSVHFAEFLAGAAQLIESQLLPVVTSDGPVTASQARQRMLAVPGNPNARAALEAAVLDAELRAHGMSMSAYLGGTSGRVPVGVSVGIFDDIPALLRQVERYVAEGYRRIKLKVQPGWDVAPIAAVRREFGRELMLQVDANEAYRASDWAALRDLDGHGLLLLEQPFPRDDLLGHARLAHTISTPVCLDESITSVQAAATAISMGACGVVNIKPGRVGGYLEARSIHDLCLGHGVPVFCGGVLESGIGRAANVALASLPNFSLPGDISATSRYYRRDITQDFELVDGFLEVPTGPGSGAVVDMEALREVTLHQRSTSFAE